MSYFVKLECFSLQYLLRQGKPAVQALHELEVLTTDYAGKDTPLLSTDPGHRSAFVPAAVCTVVKGRLYVRTGNIGKYRKDAEFTGNCKFTGVL